MVSLEKVQKLALAFEEATESPHFEKTSFRVRKKIFATMHKEKRNVVVKLSTDDQDIFTSKNDGIVEPVPGGWGRKGWTMIQLDNCDAALFQAILTTSYCTVAPKKLALKYQSE